VDPQSGVLIDPEGRMLLMLARPVRPALDLKFNRVLLQGLEEHVARVREAWQEEGWESPAPTVEFTGGYVVTLDDSELIVSDAIVGIASSLVGVMALFLVAFRRRAAIVYAFVPIVTGLGLTFAFGALVLGRLNSLTSAFGGLLIGLGIDFIIVLYGRYVDERRAGLDHAAAVDAMGAHTGVGVLLGAVTTAATFYAFLVTDFQGLWELGLLTGTGILLLVLSVYTLLPALLSLLQDRRASSRHVIRSFGSDRLCAASLRRARLTLWLVVAASVVFALGLRNLRFDDDIQNMRSPDNRGIVLRNEVMASFGMRFTPMTVRVDATTEAAALDKARVLLPELEELVDGENLAEVDSIVRMLPAVSVQEQVFEVLEKANIEDLEERFAVALGGQGLNPSAFSRGVERFEAALDARTPLAVADLDGTIFEAVASRYIAGFDEGVSVAIRCYPPAGKWRRGAPPALEQLVARHEGVVLTGPNVVSAELRQLVWGDALRASALGMVLVFLLLWADFGSPVRSLLALFPLGLGMVWMLGTMSWLGLQVNFMNIFVVTMVIGIGVDYSVHLLHRWTESGGDPEALAQTAKAIAVAALTTMVGFGSLVLSHYPGLRSVGAAAILGALATAVLSITALPVVLRMLGRLQRRRFDA
jgi:predicted RND superfamily exporter protein